VHGTFSRDFRNRDTAVDLGAAFASDSIEPVGGAPRPLVAMLPEGQTGNKLGNDSKTVVDLLIGVTQVLGPRTLGQVNYSVSRSEGYLTDPYKLVSVVDPATGDPDTILYESRPDSRVQHALFLRVKHQLRASDVLDGSYRYATGDWGVDSHTVDLRYRWVPGRRFYLQPHLRYYVQGAADFYEPYLLGGQPLPDHASADSRLGEFDGITLGLKYGLPVGEGREWSARVEFYTQSGTSPPGAFGSLRELELAPSLDALIFQIGHRF
jgi:hypothetical protein